MASTLLDFTTSTHLTAAGDSQPFLQAGGLPSTYTMGRQDEKWRDEEKAWLVKQYETPEVQAIFKEAQGKFLHEAAKYVYTLYKAEWTAPLQIEPESKYRARLSNARGEQKKEIIRKPAESPEQAQARVESRELVC